MKLKHTITITFVNSVAKKVVEFKESHKITHNEIYLKGLEIIEKEVKK